MRIPIDQERFNANVLGAIGYEAVSDFDTGRQKMVGKEEPQPAWVIHVNYRDASDAFGEPETVRIRYVGPDPKVFYGPIVLGGVECQDGQVATKGGVLKHWISYSCQSFTQAPPPSSRRPPEPPVVEPVKAGS